MKTIGLIGGMSWESTAEYYRLIMKDVAQQGAEGIILGCTDFDLLVGGGDSPVPIFDTTRIHALAAVERALQPDVPRVGVNDALTSPLAYAGSAGTPD